MEHSPSPLSYKDARRSFLAIIALRTLFFTLLLFGLDRVVRFGSNPYLLSTATFLGTLMGSWIAFQRVRLLATLFLTGVLYLLVRGGFEILFHLQTQSPQEVIFPFVQLLHFNLAFGLFLLSYLSAWIFWKSYHAITLEIICFSSFLLYLFSGHRNFRFSDAPKIVGELAWLFGTTHLTILILLGAALALLLVAYLTIGTLPWKPRADRQGLYRKSHTQHPRILGASALTLTFLLLIGGISRQIFFQYYQSAQSLGSNGVGLSEPSEEAIGKSPLGFHSALGSNSQPAGLVRLDGDYQENPFSPMLYLREGALSQFDGHELVDAGKVYDDDIPYSSPNASFTRNEDMDLLERVPIVQSIYLLTDHKAAFGLDYPVSLARLKNPAPAKFKAAYKVYSLAPTYSREELSIYSSGDPRWSDEKREHYLQPHPDERYELLARQIAQGLVNPADIAFALTDYLSQTSIYTLTPKHEVDPTEDPVAPFLFGDHRGYCVHFAHATTYMLRALGIPARIATGYLTDLSQAKDGHILLRMSDRHAWAEAYITEKGWVPFDTQPEQVESHADTEVDLKLLEELMGLVGPGEELFDEDILEGESGIEEPQPYELP
ncbi:MAG: transglutaminase domain-containing protein, partial [Bdellovibrionales bacterium]|nr:transglutaminase domain-containing protein [Bdellovibrionales bacterium]